MKHLINKIIENKYTEYFLLLLIIINIICIGLETDKTIYLAYKILFYKIELISVIIFTVEYILRLITLEHIK